MMPEAFSIFVDQCRSRTEASLARLLPNGDHPPHSLHSAMRYSALAPGKRIRPILVYAAGHALNVAPERLDAPAAAVELIHAFSLVHDDLPAMDDDDLRRGRPTCHKAYDEPTAILAGDALQTLAFQVLAQDRSGTPPTSIVKMVEALSLASGSLGMAGGQMLDMEGENRDLELPELENIHIHKTGALIRASVNMAVLADEQSRSEQHRRLDHYAKCIGLAFQIRDDILDIESDTETLGKTQGKDINQNKATYPALLGLKGAKEKADLLIDDALQSLDIFDQQADPLRNIAEFVIRRVK